MTSRLMGSGAGPASVADHVAPCAADVQKEDDRNNLLLITRLVIRGLLEYCMQSKNRMISPDQPQLNHLFVMVEKVFRHGFKFKSAATFISLKTPEQELWQMFERIGQLSVETAETISCVQQLPNVQSPIGRVRAFLRLSFMQKKLAEYVQLLIESKPLVSEYYEPHALLGDETSGVVLAGSLIGLRVIDCNLFLKEQDLMKQSLSVDLNMYIKIPTVSLADVSGVGDEEEDGDIDGADQKKRSSVDRLHDQAAAELTSILDQKNYVEEINQRLKSNVEYLQKRLVLLEAMNRHKSPAAVSQDDKDGATSTAAAESGVDEPTTVEGAEDCASTLSRSEQLETAMELMERQMHEKQDALVDLHQQIDDVKRINIDLYQKLRTLEQDTKRKGKEIASLEKKADRAANESKLIIDTLQNDLALARSELSKTETLCGNLRQELEIKTQLCSTLQSEMADMQKTAQVTADDSHKMHSTINTLREEVAALTVTGKDFTDLKRRYDELDVRCRDYEQTLEEMGVHLGESKLAVEEMQEGQRSFSGAMWESDRDAVVCRSCQLRFSVARRRHHCRNCGMVFCNNCSDSRIQLPSAPDPVRVCDACYAVLLQRYSAKPDG